MNTLSHNCLGSSTLNAKSSKGSLRYKENVAAIFQKLNALQQTSEAQKSQMHNMLLGDFAQKENKVIDTNKTKTIQLNSILKAVAALEKEFHNQQNEEQKMRRKVKAMIEEASRQLDLNFERLEKERIKGQNSLQQLIESKLESFVLKNKSAWSPSVLFNKPLFAQEIQHLKKEHLGFLDSFGKQVNRLRKQTAAAMNELGRAMEEQVSQNDEEQVTAFLRSVHMEVSSKLKGLEEQRERTEKRVVEVLERVVASCISESPPSYI